MTEEEYADFTERLKNYDMSQAEFIRQAITRATIRPIVTVSPVNDELLSAVGKLIAEYGKIGGNLNQIARALNEYGTPYNTLSVEVRAAISDLAALKFEVLRKVGDAVGNIQAYPHPQHRPQEQADRLCRSAPRRVPPDRRRPGHGLYGVCDPQGAFFLSADRPIQRGTPQGGKRSGEKVRRS